MPVLVVPVLAATEVRVSVPGASAAFSAVFSAAACELAWLAADVSPAGDAPLAGVPWLASATPASTPPAASTRASVSPMVQRAVCRRSRA